MFRTSLLYDSSPTPPPASAAQADTVVPSLYNPVYHDRYAYVLNNPVRNNDPTGHISQGEEKDADQILKQLAEYGVRIIVDWGIKDKQWQEGLWTLSELQTVLDSVKDLAAVMGGTDNFKSNLGEVTITQKRMKPLGSAKPHKITLSADGFTKWTVVHELAHAWDGAHHWKFSKSMSSSLGAGFDHPLLHFLFPNNPNYWYDPGSGPPPCGVDARLNSKEDFAEAVTAYVYPSEASAKASKRGWPYHDTKRGYSFLTFADTPRGQYIMALLVASR